jgi:prepilin-type processing-associated H-X9-DG protein
MSLFKFLSGVSLTLLLLLGAGPGQAAPIKDGDKPDPKGSAEFPDIEPDALLVAHLRVGSLWSSPLFKEVFERAAKAEGGVELLRDAERWMRKEFGFWPGDIDTITFCFPEFPSKRRDEEGFIVVVTAAKALDRKQFLKPQRQGPARREGFIALGDRMLLRLVDDRTAVIVHEDLVERYLAGYAKDKAGWPMSKALLKAAAGHDLVVSFNSNRVPVAFRGEVEPEEAALLAAKSYTLVGDLKDKELCIELRAAFPDESAAKNAMENGTKLIGELARLIGAELQKPRTKDEWGSALVLLKEAQRAIKDLKIEQFGSDVRVRGAATIDFPVEKYVADAVTERRLAADRKPSQQNLMQLGLAIHNHYNATNKLVISGTGAKGEPIKNLKEKSLLSWRVAMLPYLEQEDLYKQFKLDEAWDSEHNKKLIAKMPKLYAPVNGVKAPEGHTFYQMVIGPRAMRPGFGIENIPDGTSNTIAVVEAAQPVVWTKPDDISVPGEELPKDLLKKFGGVCKHGFNVLMWDGSVRWIDSRKLSEETLWRAIQPDDGFPLGNDW